MPGFGLGLRATGRRRGKLIPPVVLAALGGTFSLPEDAIAGAVAGALTGKTAGSTLSLVDDAGGRVALSGTNIVRGATALDYETATSHSFTVRETLTGATNTPRDTVRSLTVTDVAEAAAVLGRINGLTGTSTSHALSFDVAPSAGQLLVLAFSAPLPAADSFGLPVGWTVSAEYAAGNTITHVMTKVSDGSESTVTVTTSTATKVAWAAYRVSSGAVRDSLSNATATSTNPNPPSQTFAGGSGNYLVIAGCTVDSSLVASAAPSGYSNLQTRSSGLHSIATAEKAVTAAASEDPGGFTHGSSVAWQAWTLAIR